MVRQALSREGRPKRGLDLATIHQPQLRRFLGLLRPDRSLRSDCRILERHSQDLPEIGLGIETFNQFTSPMVPGRIGPFVLNDRSSGVPRCLGRSRWQRS